MALEKNIAALLRADARTIHVSFINETPLDDLVESNWNAEQDRLFVAEQRRVAKAGGSLGYAVQPARSKTYTYVTHLPVTVGNVLVVPTSNRIALARVEHVDDEVKIEPGSSTAYKWAIAVVDLDAYQANEQRNREIEQTVAEGMRANLRRSFATSFMAGLAPEANARLGSLIGETAALPSGDLAG